jgi:hypothetical protein
LCPGQVLLYKKQIPCQFCAFFEKKKKFFEVPKSPGNPGFFRSGPVRRALTNGPEAGMIRLKELDETG